MTKILTSTFDKTKTVISSRQRFDITPDGGTVVKISCKIIDPDSKLTTSVLKGIGTDELSRDVDEYATDAEDLITLVDIEDLDTVFALLGGLNGLVKGTGIGYVKSPTDAAGKVRAIIGLAGGLPFACSIKRPDGAVRIGGKDFSKTSLVVRNLSGAPLKWAPAADAPDTAA